MAKRGTGKVNQHGVEMGMRAYETRGLTDADVDGLVEIRENNTEAWLSALNQALSRGLEEVGLVAEGHAKAACPVDTGRLRNSITHARLDERHEAIGTNVEYAAEWRNENVPPFNFVADAELPAQSADLGARLLHRGQLRQRLYVARVVLVGHLHAAAHVDVGHALVHHLVPRAQEREGRRVRRREVAPARQLVPFR